MEILLILAAIVLYNIFTKIRKKKKYEQTEYYLQTKNSYEILQSDKGLQGEFHTYQCLEPLIGYKKFLFNVYVPKADGETTELDVVLLHESGIYVFESKNYSGWIFGTESQQYWTQTLPIGQGRSQKTQFFNPVLQNEGHLKWLQLFLKDQTLPLYSFIVFSDRCTLKDITLTSGQHCITYQKHLLSAVRQKIKQSGTQLSPQKIDTLFEILFPLTQRDEAEKVLHILNIKQKMQNKHAATYDSSSDQALCPCCGGTLVMRTATKGSRRGKNFLGCSNYPNCSYIKNLSD